MNRSRFVKWVQDNVRFALYIADLDFYEGSRPVPKNRAVRKVRNA